MSRLERSATGESGGPAVAVTAAGTVGVLGAGTMGAGIAQLACHPAQARTLLHDPVPEALTRGMKSIAGHLRRGVEKGRIDQADADAALDRLQAAPALDALADCELIVEAAPESLELKRDLYESLSGIVAEDCVLATNTSSLPVTAIASAASHPERVVGMHFFNPPPLMALLEVVAGEQSGEAALDRARATGEAMGKRVILASDGPGFLVNRCGRPFYGEGLRLAHERFGSFEQIDRIYRMSGGFRMGPFELMDLVGVDVNFEVSKSFYAQSFGEPRWKPSPIAARMVAAGRLGRKSGRGYYDYGDGPHRPNDPEPPDPATVTGARRLVVAGDLVIAEELRTAARAAGFTVTEVVDPGSEVPWLIVDCGADEDAPPLQGGPCLVLCAEDSLGGLDPAGNAAGFHALPPFDESLLVELTRSATTSDVAAQSAEELFAALGKRVEWVPDAPGLVLGRVVCQMVNEAAFALGEGVGEAADIDTGLVQGLNHPRGPLEWGDRIGLDHVLAVLDGLHEFYREERYRAAPGLRRLVLEGRLGRQTGGGFFANREG